MVLLLAFGNNHAIKSKSTPFTFLAFYENGVDFDKNAKMRNFCFLTGQRFFVDAYRVISLNNFWVSGVSFMTFLLYFCLHNKMLIPNKEFNRRALAVGPAS